MEVSNYLANNNLSFKNVWHLKIRTLENFFTAWREGISFQSKSLVSIKIYVSYFLIKNKYVLLSGLSQTQSFLRPNSYSSSFSSQWQSPEVFCFLDLCASTQGLLWCYLAGPDFSNHSSALFGNFLILKKSTFSRLTYFCLLSH